MLQVRYAATGNSTSSFGSPKLSQKECLGSNEKNFGLLNEGGGKEHSVCVIVGKKGKCFYYEAIFLIYRRLLKSSKTSNNFKISVNQKKCLEES